MAETNVQEPLQGELDLANLGEGAQETVNAAPEQAVDNGNGERKYSPSDATMERLNKLPKAEIKEKFGIDLDYLIKHTARYGVLEALAFGRYTPSPISISIAVPNCKRITGSATVKLNAFVGRDGKNVLYCDFHRVGLKLKRDENGAVMTTENGKPIKEYDRNPLTENDILSFNGEDFTPEQMDRLRLTGNFGEAKVVTSSFGNEVKTSMVLISVDPYNNHELITVDTDLVAKRLSADPVFKCKLGNEIRTFNLGKKAIADLSVGKGVWLGDAESGRAYAQYNAATGRLERAQDFKIALQKEQEQKHAQALRERREETAAQNVKVGQKI